MAKAEIACKQGCGKTFTTEGWRVKHELKCNGKPIAMSGRIEANGGVPAPSAKRTKKSKRASSLAARAHRTRRSAPEANAAAAEPLSRARILASLRADAAKIQAAIEAIEAIA